MSATKKSFFYFVQTLHIILGPTSSWVSWTGYFNLSLAKYMCVDVQAQHSRLWLQLGTILLYPLIWALFVLVDWMKHVFK
eukprot:m.448938 g.448938  ORF g.448938 m.448938 type:complete len:80 (+) comp21505_c1_seq36:4542-4781(+)